MAALDNTKVRQVWTQGPGPRVVTLFALQGVSGNDTIDFAAMGIFSRVIQAVLLASSGSPAGPPGLIATAQVAVPSGLANDAAYLLVDGIPV